MKKLIRLTLFTALVLAFSLPALAQTTPATTTTPAATQDDTEAKAALYSKFRDNIKGNPQAAYEAGKEYLQKYEAKDGAEDQYVKYIKKWVASYDKLARRNQFNEEIKAKDYNRVFITGKQILAEEPEDLSILFELSKAGLSAATAETPNESNNADAANYARKAIQLIQSGKTFEKDKPIANKNEILGGLNYALGIFLTKSQPTEAINYLISAASFEGYAKKDPQTYVLLAETYQNSEYTKLRNDYTNNCKTDEQVASATCTQLTTKINDVVDHMIDALARAISYSQSSPNAASYATARNAWMTQLTEFYKYRNNGSDTGLKELIASVANKPLPKPGDPANVIPASTTPASSTSPSSSSTTTTPANTTTAKPNTTTTQPTNGAAKKTTPKRSR